MDVLWPASPCWEHKPEVRTLPRVGEQVEVGLSPFSVVTKHLRPDDL